LGLCGFWMCEGQFKSRNCIPIWNEKTVKLEAWLFFYLE